MSGTNCDPWRDPAMTENVYQPAKICAAGVAGLRIAPLWMRRMRAGLAACATARLAISSRAA
ncbi:hypothetical protein AAFG07_39200 [Bradyrhizobium sp. B097]|uniref:hypothetical protein n=1 Tax=Bradyrhizobium sp. B097 TaxID=3140244 RepID=UPI003183AA7E